MFAKERSHWIDSPHPRLALRALRCAKVRSGILPAQSARSARERRAKSVHPIFLRCSRGANGRAQRIDQRQRFYTATRLYDFRGNLTQHNSNDFIMHGVARTLDDDSIQAIASWLASLPPKGKR